MNKDNNIKFRISSDEKKLLIRLAKLKGISLTDYIMYCLNNSYLTDLNNGVFEEKF